MITYSTNRVYDYRALTQAVLVKVKTLRMFNPSGSGEDYNKYSADLLAIQRDLERMTKT